MFFDKKNIITQRPDNQGFKNFTILDMENIDEFLKRISSMDDVDGLLIEHGNWYKDPTKVDFDPRLYSVVKGYDGKYYAISFRDFRRVDEIMEYENLTNPKQIDTKVKTLESLGNSFVLSKPSHVLDSIAPQDPLNIYKLSTKDEDKRSIVNTYRLDYNAATGLKLIARVYEYLNRGYKKIVISADEKGVEELNIFFIKYFLDYCYQSSYVPSSIPYFSKLGPDLIITSSDIAKLYELNGYKVIEATLTNTLDFVRYKEKKKEEE